MRKVKELMEQLGFNESASFEAKKAFIKHLIREAHFQETVRSQKNALTTVALGKEEDRLVGEQLSLFAATGTDNK